MSRWTHHSLAGIRRRRGRAVTTLAVAVSCLGIGAGASAIASAGATTDTTAAPAATATPAARTSGAAHRRAMWRHIPGVHASVVVDTRRGWRTLTLDRGYVDSVNGTTLTVREANRKATYDTVSVTVPAGSRVRNNGHRATLGSLTPGERVVVVQGLPHTLVVAHTPRS